MTKLSAHVLGICISVSSLAAGEPIKESPESGKVGLAHQHFQKGVALYKERSFDAALAEFERAYELAPDPRLLYNLAQVQLERHDYVGASKRFRAYLVEGADGLASDRRAEVEAEIQRLGELVAQLDVTVNVAGAEVVVDGARAGTLPLLQPLLVNPGNHRVEVRKEGYGSRQRELTVAGGEMRRLELELVRDRQPTVVSDPPPTRPVTEGQTAARDRTALWVSLSASVALGTTAVLLALETQSKKRAFERDLGRFSGDSSQIEEDRAALKLFAGLTDGFAAGTAVAAGFFTYFAVFDNSGPAKVPSAHATQVRVLVAPAGMGLSGEF